MIEFRTLGTVVLTGADGLPLRGLLAQPRRLALFAYLAAATPHGPRRRDHLLPLFWPDLDQARARAALRQALHVIRAELGPDALRNRGDEEIGLNFELVRCDLVEFERAVATGQLGEALDLYRGDLLEGFFIPDAPEFERWLELERARLREAAAGAARTAIERSEADGHFPTAARWARRATRLAPLDETLFRRLITLLDRLGDRAGALAAYEDFAQRLAQEFEAEPAAETQVLIDAVRARHAALQAPVPPRVELVTRLRSALADRYRVEREVASGGAAVVFLAHDRRHDRPVAIKVLRPELAAAVTTERFLREIRTAARLRHPRVVPLLDSGEADALPYFVMPYFPGETLRERLKREVQLPIADAIAIARDVAEALGYAHATGLVHRDVTPGNILLEEGRATLADFGIARAITFAASDRLTQSGIVLGSPAYMSPEQAGDEIQFGPQSDIYALGCVLYEMLTGAPPFTGSTSQALLSRHALDPVPPIRTVRGTVPPQVEQAVLRALAKAPPDRHATAEEFSAALAAPPTEGRHDRPTRAHRRPWVLVGTALAAVIALVLLASRYGWAGHTGQRPTARAMLSLAVLPLQDLSSDTTYDALADGLTMALNTRLGEGPLQVISPRAAEHFKGSHASERAIGDSLGVAELVEGDLQRTPDSLEVNLRLIEAATGRELWARHFEGRQQNQFALEEAMARGVRSALNLPEGTRTPVPPTANGAAYNLYLRGKIRMQYEDRADDSVAITLLRQAVALDPTFAQAYAELAQAYGLRATQFAPDDLDSRDSAAFSAEKALGLSPNLAEGHVARAFLLWGPERHFAHDLAIEEDRRALALNPNLAYAHHHLGTVYLHIGLLDSAIAEFKQTLALDPAEAMAQQRIGIALVYQGRYEEGLRIFQQVPPATNPALWHYQVAWVLMYLGRDAEALDLIEQYLRESPEDRGGVVTASRAVLYARRGDKSHAQADIEAAIRKGKNFQHFHHAAYSIAMAYAQLHQPDSAVRFLRQAANDGLPCYPCFRNDPFLAGLQGDPGFEALMQQLRGQWEKWRVTLVGGPSAAP